MAIATKQMEVGQELPSVKKEVTLDRMRLFTRWVSRNIHTDWEWAKKAGLPAPIAAGLMSHTYLSELLTNFFGESWLKGGKLSGVSFIRYIVPGDTITVKGTIREKVVEGSVVKFTMEVWCENGMGEKVTIGTATASLH